MIQTCFSIYIPTVGIYLSEPFVAHLWMHAIIVPQQMPESPLV